MPDRRGFLGVLAGVVASAVLPASAVAVAAAPAAVYQFPSIIDLLRQRELEMFNEWAAEFEARLWQAPPEGGTVVYITKDLLEDSEGAVPAGPDYEYDEDEEDDEWDY